MNVVKNPIPNIKAPYLSPCFGFMANKTQTQHWRAASGCPGLRMAAVAAKSFLKSRGRLALGGTPKSHIQHPSLSLSMRRYSSPFLPVEESWLSVCLCVSLSLPFSQVLSFSPLFSLSLSLSFFRQGCGQRLPARVSPPVCYGANSLSLSLSRCLFLSSGLWVGEALSLSLSLSLSRGHKQTTVPSRPPTLRPNRRLSEIIRQSSGPSRNQGSQPYPTKLFECKSERMLPLAALHQLSLLDSDPSSSPSSSPS